MFEVIGFRNVDYVNKVGKRVLGKTLYVKFEAEGVEGFRCKEIFVRNTVEYIPRLEDVIEVYYDAFGNVIKVFMVD